MSAPGWTAYQLVIGADNSLSWLVRGTGPTRAAAIFSAQHFRAGAVWMPRLPPIRETELRVELAGDLERRS